MKKFLKKNKASIAFAIGNRIKSSPQKLSLLAGLIRGKSISRAISDLVFCRKKNAPVVKKVLESAISNAENNHGADIDNLIVGEVWVGKSLLLKRWHARARGRSARIHKHYSRISVVLHEC